MGEPDRTVITAGSTGNVITAAKAAAIIASGGSVTITRSREGRRYEAWVSGGSRVTSPGVATVNWASYGPQDAAGTLAFAEAVRMAGGIARVSGATPDPFGSVPAWVGPGLTTLAGNPLLACYRAAARYQHGDVDVAGAWQWLTEQEAREEQAT